MYSLSDIRRHGTRCWCGQVHLRGARSGGRRHRSWLYCLWATLTDA